MKYALFLFLLVAGFSCKKDNPNYINPKYFGTYRCTYYYNGIQIDSIGRGYYVSNVYELSDTITISNSQTNNHIIMKDRYRGSSDIIFTGNNQFQSNDNYNYGAPAIHGNFVSVDSFTMRIESGSATHSYEIANCGKIK